jgi:hypothetical protein
MPLFDGSSFQLADSGRNIVFTRRQLVANLFIRRMNGDTGFHRITSGTAFKREDVAMFSPDGGAIAFAEGSDAAQNVFVVRVDSSAAKQVTFMTDGHIKSLAWSPDSRRIAYCALIGGQPKLMVASPAGDPPLGIIAPELSYRCLVSWLTDEVLLYQRAGNRNFMLRSLSGIAQGRLRSVDSIGWIFWPVANVDRSHVAVYWSRLDDGAGVWLFGVRDSTSKLILRTNSYAVRPLRFSSEGSGIYGVRLSGAANSLMRIQLTGTVDALPLANECRVADISPDGSFVLCLVVESSTSDAWMIRDFDISERFRRQ